MTFSGKTDSSISSFYINMVYVPLPLTLRIKPYNAMGSSFCEASYNNRARVPILYKAGITVYYFDGSTTPLVLSLLVEDSNLDAVL